jgi:hypothetical protein
VRDAFRFSVWPGIWPAAVVGIGLQLAKAYAPAKLSGVLLEAVAASLIYFALFIVAIGRSDRTGYMTRVRSLIGRGPRLAPAA